MKFLSLILLLALFAGSVPALADVCCKSEASVSDCHKDNSEKAETSCSHCMHHSHASAVPALHNNKFERIAEKLVSFVSERLDSDLQYPLIDPPAHS